MLTIILSIVQQIPQLLLIMIIIIITVEAKSTILEFQGHQQTYSTRIKQQQRCQRECDISALANVTAHFPQSALQGSIQWPQALSALCCGRQTPCWVQLRSDHCVVSLWAVIWLQLDQGTSPLSSLPFIFTLTCTGAPQLWVSLWRVRECGAERETGSPFTLIRPISGLSACQLWVVWLRVRLIKTKQLRPRSPSPILPHIHTPHGLGHYPIRMHAHSHVHTRHRKEQDVAISWPWSFETLMATWWNTGVSWEL